MHLCTLHPSLSALALNLELNKHLSFGVFDSSLSHRLGVKTPETGYFSPSEQPEVYDILSADTCAQKLKELDDSSLIYFSDAFLDSNLHSQIEKLLFGFKNSRVELHSLTQILEYWDMLAKQFGNQARARDLHQRTEAQLMDWTSNFYARLRGKRVLVFSQFKPLTVASSWINDLVRRIGAIAPEIESEADQIVVDWNFIAEFDPHIMLFAPLGANLQQSAQIFFELENLKGREQECFASTAAAKRGDLYFCNGMSGFYSMDYRIIDTLGILVSAIAGLDSGYITDRDSFYKARFLELQRHKFVK